MTTKSSNSDAEKSLYFKFNLYPASLSDDWKIRLETTDRPMAISPLHDRDLFSGTEAFEKQMAEAQAHNEQLKYILSSEAYEKRVNELQELRTRTLYREQCYHVIYIAENPVTTQTVRNKFEKLLGSETAVDEVQIISSSVRNAYDYLTHGTVDAMVKDKHIYNKEDIVTINNFDVDRCELEFIRSREKKRPKNNIPDVVSDYSSSNNYQPNQTSRQNDRQLDR